MLLSTCLQCQIKGLIIKAVEVNIKVSHRVGQINSPYWNRKHKFRFRKCWNGCHCRVWGFSSLQTCNIDFALHCFRNHAEEGNTYGCNDTYGKDSACESFVLKLLLVLKYLSGVEEIKFLDCIFTVFNKAHSFSISIF